MTTSLKFHYAHCLKELIGEQHGLSRQDLSSMEERFREAQSALSAGRKAGELGFFDLPYKQEEAAKAKALAKKGKGRFDTLVVIGIGGSALGCAALKSALRPAFWDLLPAKARQGHMRCFILDNVDPWLLSGLLKILDPKKTLFNVISKSGDTSESLANYFVIKKILMAKLGKNFRHNVVVTTDPAKGYLRESAEKEGLASLSVPGNVGGRFSVLSSVGLLPAACMGIDVDKILAGARAMETACRTQDLFKNPAGLYAVIQYLFYWKGRPISVMFPYSQPLQYFGDWFCQLWAESLGKEQDLQGARINVGPTPVRALGVTDQHSQLQLYMEGPHDKVITFLSVKDLSPDLTIPKFDGSFLGGSTLSKLLKAEEQGTKLALSKAGRPHGTVEIPKITPETFGELVMFFELAVAYAGRLFGINTFDQPGVELSKKLTKALMGQTAFKSHLKDIEALVAAEKQCSAVV